MKNMENLLKNSTPAKKIDCAIRQITVPIPIKWLNEGSPKSSGAYVFTKFNLSTI
ncbi:hypothetical protein CCAND38_610013 [Capnocytophaga canis]|uniref:Uncharacterized protein n=1 Tax=Capnocytophaga canis TaxID=1848903 RepID=A0A0B7ID24_9FLAO|nr:hypothetical protein CCAND38_610013 [Capnocytophaga canis]